MNYKDILRIKPWLKLYNGGNLSNRLLKATNGNAFIVYNNIQQEYQLHTVKAEQLSADSTNANIPQDVLNQWIIEDYNSNDFDKYVDDIQSEKQLLEHIINKHNSDEAINARLGQRYKTIERVLGTKI